jgi:ABC-type dipeptide/oligopeptide/nickel transport system ATPase subunit
MQNYVVTLESPVVDSFRCRKAADSVNLDIKKKSIHHLEVGADITTSFNIGVIFGSSGSGKTTLARQMFGSESLLEAVDPAKPIIEQFPQGMSYDECVGALTGVGLTSIPCWIRTANTLSNGQRARAEAAIKCASDTGRIVVIDEWTSVVDRDVARVMSHSIQKFARRQKKKIVLITCHWDVVEWLNPDWVIDCNTQTYKDRRNMVGAHERTDRLRLDIKECSKHAWRYFSKYHYLSEKLPGGKLYTFGLFRGEDQVGFICFACYSMVDRKLYHFNRAVVHPDFVGLGLGAKFATECSKIMNSRGFRIKSKFTSPAMYRHLKNHPNWRCMKIESIVTRADSSPVKVNKKITTKEAAARNASKLWGVRYYYFDFIPS